MQVERVTDPDDPRISDYQNLKDARLERERARFIVEGRVNLRVLLELSPFEPHSILLSDRAWRAMEAELEGYSLEAPIYVADRPVIDAIVGFPIHRGCLAVCDRGPTRDPLALASDLLEREEAPRIVIVEALRNHDNIGGIFRNAMGLGGRAVLLCPLSVDPLYRKGIRTSMGGSLVVPFARGEDLLLMLEGLRRIGFEILALDPAPDGLDLSEVDPDEVGPAAILVGTEGEGLTAAALAASDRRVRIEMEPGVDSINVSVATAIALHRLRRTGSNVGSHCG